MKKMYSTPIQKIDKREMMSQQEENRRMAHESNPIMVTDMRNIFYHMGDPRRRLERADSNLVQPDYNAIANCPTQGYQTYFPGRPWIPNSRS